MQDCGKALWYLRRFKEWHGRAADAVWPAAEDVEAAERWADPETIVQAFGLAGYLEQAVAGLLSICLYDGDEDIVLDNIILDVEQAIAEAA